MCSALCLHVVMILIWFCSNLSAERVFCFDLLIIDFTNSVVSVPLCITFFIVLTTFAVQNHVVHVNFILQNKLNM